MRCIASNDKINMCPLNATQFYFSSFLNLKSLYWHVSWSIRWSRTKLCITADWAIQCKLGWLQAFSFHASLIFFTYLYFLSDRHLLKKCIFTVVYCFSVRIKRNAALKKTEWGRQDNNCAFLWYQYKQQQQIYGFKKTLMLFVGIVLFVLHKMSCWFTIRKMLNTFGSNL